MLETLGRLSSEETREWEELELIEREGAGDGGREETLEGTSGSAPGGRNRSGYRRPLRIERRWSVTPVQRRPPASDLHAHCCAASPGEAA